MKQMFYRFVCHPHTQTHTNVRHRSTCPTDTRTAQNHLMHCNWPLPSITHTHTHTHTHYCSTHINLSNRHTHCTEPPYALQLTTSLHLVQRHNSCAPLHVTRVIKNHVTTDDQSATSDWCRTHLGTNDHTLFWLRLLIAYCLGTPALMREIICLVMSHNFRL